MYLVEFLREAFQIKLYNNNYYMVIIINKKITLMCAFFVLDIVVSGVWIISLVLTIT